MGIASVFASRPAIRIKMPMPRFTLETERVRSTFFGHGDARYPVPPHVIALAPRYSCSVTASGAVCGSGSVNSLPGRGKSIGVRRWYAS